MRDAATVAVVRDGPQGLEVLLVQRAAALSTHGGHWAFPGGAVDPEDGPDDPADALDPAAHELAAARAAARREAWEEIGIDLDADALVPLSHWTTPDGAPTIFRTWFFVAACPAQVALTPAPDEVAAAAWHRPVDAHERHHAGELSLPVPQFVTLAHLAEARSAAHALARAAASPPRRFHGRPTTVAGGLVWRYEGDAAWEHGDLDAPGPRHRMWMVTGAWRYEEQP